MKALVLLSGGVDSSTCLVFSKRKNMVIMYLALSMSYGQKHSRELSLRALVSFIMCNCLKWI